MNNQQQPKKLCIRCPRKADRNCSHCLSILCFRHVQYVGDNLPFCSQDCIDKYVEARVSNYCCSEMAELRILYPYTRFEFNWEPSGVGGGAMTGYDAGYDSEKEDDAIFLINFCQFCGKKLIK